MNNQCTFKQGDMIGISYKVIKKLGAGSFGTIYLAEHLPTKKKVAIKTEPINAQFPLIIYEANVTLLLHGATEKSLQRGSVNAENVRNEKGFAKIYSYG